MNTHPLTHYLPLAVKSTALAAFIFAVLKVVLTAQTFGLLAAVAFAGLHLPLCLFSLLFVLWLFAAHQSMGFLALASVLLNAVLI
ncbi:hypothetical protein SAMN02745130_03947 [Thiothrix eikelboomii]|uniref:Uncharacterized protein n=1 Tax=Thiothrix eikelboomii TaxID=92487 RepID=A0A1T4Y5A7_9GAMM|nr:hypothetical protein [Thiothrix eikelboomii]SKA96997.1 hypothetical protein SAMN02745130_03947 [Thiothrix eikelboomii]